MSLPGLSEKQARKLVRMRQKHGYLDMNMLSEDQADDEERIAGFTLSNPFPIDPAAVGYPKKEETTKLESSVARDRKSCNSRSRAREEGRDSLERRHYSRDRSYSPRRSYRSPSRSRDGKHEYHYRKRSISHDRSPEDYRRRSSGGRRRHVSRDRESDRDHYRRRHDHHSGHHRRSKFYYSDSDSDSDEEYRTLRGEKGKSR
ncbi:TRAF3-interacting protein 1-like [Dreissena polymorpha]|nr:TRAF3-interacting protein 1-like [Dreissena polymorpha]